MQLPRPTVCPEDNRMYRELLKKAGTYSIAGMATRAASFLMLPVYTRFLSPADYGVMELLDLTTSIIGLLFGARVGSALFYYYASAVTRRDKDRWICNVFFFSIALGLLILAVTLPSAGLISSLIFGTPQYGPFFRLLFIGMACSLPTEVGYSAIRAFNEPGLYVRVTVIQTIVLVVLNVVFLVGFHMGVRSMLTSAMISSAAVALFMAWHILSPREVSLDPKKMIQIFRYGLPLGLSGLAVFLIHYGDRAFLRQSVSLSELGVYALAYKFGMLVAFVHAPFHLYWTSQVCDIVKLPKGGTIYVRSTTLLVAVLIFAALVLALFSEPIIQVMAGPAFRGAAALIPWLTCAYLIRALGAHLQCVFIVEGKPGLELKVNAVGSVACVAAYAVLIPRFRLWGAVAATLFGFGVILIYTYWEAQRVRRFHFEYERLLRISLVAGLAAVVFYATRPENPWLQVGIAAVCAAIYPAGVWAWCLDAEEREQLWSTAKGLFKKSGTPDVETAAV